MLTSSFHSSVKKGFRAVRINNQLKYTFLQSKSQGIKAKNGQEGSKNINTNKSHVRFHVKSG